LRYVLLREPRSHEADKTEGLRVGQQANGRR